MKVYGACATDIGAKRSVNQDSIVILSEYIGEKPFAVMAVCDGVGGLDSGEIASAIVVEGVKKWFAQVLEWIDEASFDPELLFSHMKDAAEEWNEEVFDYHIVNSLELGTTMSILLIADMNYYILQVGDSRIYNFSDNELIQLTVDATATRIRDGIAKQYLSNYMGRDADLSFTSATGVIDPDMMFVACSDGFYHNLVPEDLDFRSGTKKNEQKLENKCKELISQMIERGETDNISVGFIVINK